jgi:hypothetical protein
MATLMDLIMREYGGAKPQPAQAPAFPQVYGPLTRQLATEIPLGNGSMPGGALARELATNVPLPNGSLPGGALARQLATEVPVPTGPFIPQAPRMPDEVGMQYRPSMTPRMPDEVGFQYRPSMNPLAVPGANTPIVAGLDTANRPAPMASSVTAPARPQGFFEQLFKGPQYQSNNMLLQAEGQPINFGDPNSAADFFRADALLRQQNPGFFGLLGGNNG